MVLIRGSQSRTRGLCLNAARGRAEEQRGGHSLREPRPTLQSELPCDPSRALPLFTSLFVSLLAGFIVLSMPCLLTNVPKEETLPSTIS